MSKVGVAAGPGFKHNHYVPIWYQERFLLPDRTRYHYLDLKPDEFTVDTAKGPKKITRHDIHEWGPTQCFAQDDLYTQRTSGRENRDIERFFFGDLDNKGKADVEYFASFEHPSVDPDALWTLLRYMTVQKLRTPKGLELLATVARSQHHNITLMLLQELQDMYRAVWGEAVWQIASAESSPTKFIISDHPVTVYNRECFPLSVHCLGANDPDVRRVATHTYFPLSAAKILILTNKAWARNPYQNALALRPNIELFRNAAFDFTSIQTGRELSELEVIQINYITKTRAYRYIAAGNRDWLYPERRLLNPHWRKLGDGLLLMPEPRVMSMGGEIIFGYKNRRSEVYGEYGHRPGQAGFRDKAREDREAESLRRFKAEFAAAYGQEYRASNFRLAFRRQEMRVRDDDETHSRRLALDMEVSRRPGERQRRRLLRDPSALK